MVLRLKGKAGIVSVVCSGDWQERLEYGDDRVASWGVLTPLQAFWRRYDGEISESLWGDG